MIDQGGAESAMAPAGMLSSGELIPILDRELLTGSETILLVEDEAFVREVAVQVLKSAGYVVLTAKTGAEARDLYRQFSREINLVLSDVILPDLNGRTLARELRNQNAELAVLLVTGYAAQIELTDAEFARVECLPKPFATRTLLQRVRAVLDKKRRSTGYRAVTHVCGIE